MAITMKIIAFAIIKSSTNVGFDLSIVINQRISLIGTKRKTMTKTKKISKL